MLRYHVGGVVAILALVAEETLEENRPVRYIDFKELIQFQQTHTYATYQWFMEQF